MERLHCEKVRGKAEDFTAVKLRRTVPTKRTHAIFSSRAVAEGDEIKVHHDNRESCSEKKPPRHSVNKPVDNDSLVQRSGACELDRLQPVKREKVYLHLTIKPLHELGDANRIAKMGMQTKLENDLDKIKDMATKLKLDVKSEGNKGAYRTQLDDGHKNKWSVSFEGVTPDGKIHIDQVLLCLRRELVRTFN